MVALTTAALGRRGMAMVDAVMGTVLRKEVSVYVCIYNYTRPGEVPSGLATHSIRVYTHSEWHARQRY